MGTIPTARGEGSDDLAPLLAREEASRRGYGCCRQTRGAPKSGVRVRWAGNDHDGIAITCLDVMCESFPVIRDASLGLGKKLHLLQEKVGGGGRRHAGDQCFWAYC